MMDIEKKAEKEKDVEKLNRIWREGEAELQNAIRCMDFYINNKHKYEEDMRSCPFISNLSMKAYVSHLTNEHIKIKKIIDETLNFNFEPKYPGDKNIKSLEEQILEILTGIRVTIEYFKFREQDYSE